MTYFDFVAVRPLDEPAFDAPAVGELEHIAARSTAPGERQGSIDRQLQSAKCENANCKLQASLQFDRFAICNLHFAILPS